MRFHDFGCSLDSQVTNRWFFSSSEFPVYLFRFPLLHSAFLPLGALRWLTLFFLAVRLVCFWVLFRCFFWFFFLLALSCFFFLLILAGIPLNFLSTKIGKYSCFGLFVGLLVIQLASLYMMDIALDKNIEIDYSPMILIFGLILWRIIVPWKAFAWYETKINLDISFGIILLAENPLKWIL